MRRTNEFVKVRKQGGTTVLSVGKLIPSDFRIVTLKRVGFRKGLSVTLEIRKEA